MELLLGSEEAGAAALEEDVCCVLSRLPLQEPEAARLLGAGGIPALTARLSAALRPVTRRYALVALTNLSLFPATREAILQAPALPHVLPYVAGDDAGSREQAVSALLLLSDDPAFALALHDANGNSNDTHTHTPHHDKDMAERVS